MWWGVAWEKLQTQRHVVCRDQNLQPKGTIGGFGSLVRGFPGRIWRTAQEALEVGRDTTNSRGHSLATDSPQDEVEAPLAELPDETSESDTDTV